MDKIRALLLSDSDIDNGGARAAYRLHRGLQAIGHHSQMLVRAKFSADSTVVAEKTPLTKISPSLSGLPLKLYPKYAGSAFFPQWLPDNLATRVNRYTPDIINLHWICNGYVQIEGFRKFKQPLVWTMHDMWPFTGGCTYTYECENYKKSCGSCPQLKSDRQQDLSSWVWQRKARAWKNLNLTAVSPSVWLAKRAASSDLFRNIRIEVIPNGINTSIYRPIGRDLARKVLNLSLDKRYILFGSLDSRDPRKGFYLLQEAIQRFRELSEQQKVELIVFGAKPQQEPDLGIKAHYLGRFSDDLSLAICYAAADVFIAPSTQDNLPNTVIEAMACGVPCVAFKIGGMPDMIDHYQNGYLAQPFEVEDLAQGIFWVLEDQGRYQKLQDSALNKVSQEFTQEVQAHRYASLYEEILEGS